MSVFTRIQACREQGEAAVLVTIASVEGSAPRGVGTRLLVTGTEVVGTIGGGALEHAALNEACELLRADSFSARVYVREWTLGKALSQCCGGRVSLVFERFPACDFRVDVFGAGHVAQQLATLLRQLPCIATFHDSREPWLDRIGADVVRGRRQHSRPDIDLGTDTTSRRGEGVLHTRLHDENVFAAVESCRPGSFYLVMTHSHERDLEVVEAVLAREDAAFCGLIASQSKAAAFRSRLSRKGFIEDELDGLTAPLGTSIRTGNTPMEVAIAAMADVLDARAGAAAGDSITRDSAALSRDLEPGVTRIDPRRSRLRPGR